MIFEAVANFAASAVKTGGLWLQMNGKKIAIYAVEGVFQGFAMESVFNNANKIAKQAMKVNEK